MDENLEKIIKLLEQAVNDISNNGYVINEELLTKYPEYLGCIVGGWCFNNKMDYNYGNISEHFNFEAYIMSKGLEPEKTLVEQIEILIEKEPYKSLYDQLYGITIDMDSIEKYLLKIFNNINMFKNVINNTNSNNVLEFLFVQYLKTKVISNDDLLIIDEASISDDIIELFIEKIGKMDFLEFFNENIGFYDAYAFKSIYKHFELSIDEFKKLIDTHNFDGIEYFKNSEELIRNNEIIKDFIKKGFLVKIINFLSEEQIIHNFILIKSHIITAIVQLSSSGNHLTILNNSKIFDKIFDYVNETKNYYINYLEDILPENYSDKVRITKCLLSNSRRDELNGVKRFDENWLTNIDLAIKNGYKCNKNTVISRKEEVEVFIKNGQNQVINYVNKNILDYEIVYKCMKEDLNHSIETHYNTNIINDYIKKYNNTQRVAHLKTWLYFLPDLEREFSLNDQIEKSFTDDGPTEILYKKALFNSELFDAGFKNNKYYNDYITRFNPSDAIKSYIQFIKENGFILEELIKNPSDIEKYFDENGINEFGTYTIHKDTSIYENLYKNYFKNFYVDNFNYSEILDSILKKLDYNYSYFIDFLINTLNLSYPIEEVEEDKIKKVYCLQTIDENKLIEIIKYAYFGLIDKNIIKNIIINNELSLCINFYSNLCSKWNIDDFIKFISNYEENKELCNNLINEEELTNDEKLKLQMILINGFRGAFGVIKTKDDLANFNTLIVENNNSIIKSNNTNDIKKLILNYLFNISLDEVQIIKGKYEKNVDDLGKDESNKGLKKLQSNLNNLELKKIIDEYDTIIKFILNIEKSNDLDGLKQMANILNELVHNGQLSKLYELWNLYSKLDSDIMTICGEEVNEKIINYDELLNTPEDNIPLIENEKSFIIKNISVPSEVKYDGKIIDSGTNVKMIELNGLPFVAFGHVLNAFGSGGKLSDYNHPRVIGRTHLCLSAIDDNYYSLVKRDDRGIDYVQLLFNDLPAEQLAISSHRDVSSYTQNNSKNVNAWYKGAYLPIRETIINTYHGHNGYNEYVYYREGLKPSGILIRGNEPTESEIQAAAYLSRICGKDIPLIMINIEKYPIRTKEEMQKRDEELKSYYKELYEARKKNQILQDIEKMKELNEYLMKLKLLGDSSEQLEGEQNERRK